MSRVVTFGEIMMRLNPDGYMELLQAPSLNISFAGEILWWKTADGCGILAG